MLIKNTAWLSIENKFYTHEKLVEIALSSKHVINFFFKFIHRLKNETKNCSKRSEIAASEHRAKKHPRLDAQIIEIDDDIPALSDNAFNVSYANTPLAGRLFANPAANIQIPSTEQSQNTSDHSELLEKIEQHNEHARKNPASPTNSGF